MENPIKIEKRDEMKADGFARRNRMNVARYCGENLVVAVDANEPIDTGDERGQKNFERRHAKFHCLEKIWIASDGDHFADEGCHGEEIADPELGHGGPRR